ncbi:MAG: hypothetical protein V3S46_05575 [Nitrospinota bacterium]
MRRVEGRIVRKGIVKAPGMEISSHNIAGGHSVSMRKKSVELKIASVQRNKRRLTVSVEVTNVGAGHKIPTGLPTKKFILKVSVQPEGGDFPQIKQRIYEKVLAGADGKKIEKNHEILMDEAERVISDNRIGPMEKKIEEFVFFVPENKPINVTAAVYYSFSQEMIQEAPIHSKMHEVRITVGK